MLTDNAYGKQGIRMVTVARHAGGHEVRDLTVDVRARGDFADAYAGDNSQVLPTDTMRTTVYALAAGGIKGPAEHFARRVAERLLAAGPAATEIAVTVTEHPWSRLAVGGRASPHAFSRPDAGEVETATVTVTRDGLRVEAGLAGLVLLKTAGSAFRGFLVDDYTVLAETDDRLMATSVDATWAYARVHHDFAASRADVRQAMVEVFATHESQSVQHTLAAMGEAALAACAPVAQITLRMPNRHHVAVDLTPLGGENRNVVFVATDRPYGLIEGTLTRDRA